MASDAPSVETSTSGFDRVSTDILRDYQISHELKAAYLILCLYADRTKRTCWPKQETIAARLGVSVRTVRYRIEALRDQQIISITRAHRRAPLTYQIRDEAWIKETGFAAVNAEIVDRIPGDGPKALYALLASWCADDRTTYRKQGELADCLDVTERTIYAWTKILEESEAVKVEPRRNKWGEIAANVYSLRDGVTFASHKRRQRLLEAEQMVEEVQDQGVWPFELKGKTRWALRAVLAKLINFGVAPQEAVDAVVAAMDGCYDAIPSFNDVVAEIRVA
jgi:Mn-dependent DtxR family transcriptional regulator